MMSKIDYAEGELASPILSEMLGHGLSFEQLACLAKIEYNDLRSFTKAEATPTKEQLTALASVFGVPEGELYDVRWNEEYQKANEHQLDRKKMLDAVMEQLKEIIIPGSNLDESLGGWSFIAVPHSIGGTVGSRFFRAALYNAVLAAAKDDCDKASLIIDVRDTDVAKEGIEGFLGNAGFYLSDYDRDCSVLVYDEEQNKVIAEQFLALNVNKGFFAAKLLSKELNDDVRAARRKWSDTVRRIKTLDAVERKENNA